MAGLLPFIHAQWFTIGPSGVTPLAGGTIEFYAVGSTTPKAVFADYQGNTSLGSTVTLDGAGHATIFLGAGLYKCILKDSLGAIIDTIDGVGSGGGGVGSGASFNVATIAALKAVTGQQNGDVAVVEGYYAAGDRGGGSFFYASASSGADNGGTIISPNGSPPTGRWISLSTGDYTFRQFGAKGDGVTNDTTAVTRCIAASAAAPANARATPGTYLVSGGTISVTGVRLTAEPGSQIYGAGASIVFAVGSFFDGQGERHFRALSSVDFSASNVYEIDPTWWYEYNTAAALNLAVASAGSGKKAVRIRVPFDLVSTNVSIPANVVLLRAGGTIAYTDAILTAFNTNLPGSSVPFFLHTLAGTGYVTLTDPIINVKWWGATGDGTTDDTDALTQAFKCGSLRTLYIPSGTYKVTAQLPEVEFVFGDSMNTTTIYQSYTGASSDDAMIRVRSGAEKIGFDCPTPASAPPPYRAPALRGTGGSVTMDSIRVRHNYYGIHLDGNGVIRNYSFAGSGYGVFAIHALDAVTISDASFVPATDFPSDVQTWIQTNGQAITTSGRASLRAVHTDKYSYGLFSNSGSMSVSDSYFRCKQVQLLNCSETTGQADGIWMFTGTKFYPIDNSSASYVLLNRNDVPGYPVRAIFDGCLFGNFARTAVMTYGVGVVTVQGCSFEQTGGRGPGPYLDPLVCAKNGADIIFANNYVNEVNVLAGTSGKIQILGNRGVAMYGAPAVLVVTNGSGGANALGSVVFGEDNFFTGDSAAFVANIAGQTVYVGKTVVLDNPGLLVGTSIPSWANTGDRIRCTSASSGRSLGVVAGTGGTWVAEPNFA